MEEKEVMERDEHANIDLETSEFKYDEALKVLKHEPRGRDCSLISSSDWLEIYRKIESLGGTAASSTLDVPVIELDEGTTVIVSADDSRAQEPIAGNTSENVPNID